MENVGIGEDITVRYVADLRECVCRTSVCWPYERVVYDYTRKCPANKQVSEHII